MINYEALTTFPKYKMNLHQDGDRIISYTTHVATIDRPTSTLLRHGHWSKTTSKHINYVANFYRLRITDAPRQ